MSEKMRESFEKHIASKCAKGLPPVEALERKGDGYSVPVIDACWIAYQAAWAACREEAVNACKGIERESNRNFMDTLDRLQDGRADGAVDCAAAIRGL